MSGLNDLEEKFRRLEREVNDVKEEINSDYSGSSAQSSQSPQISGGGIMGAFKTSLADLVRWINGMTGATRVVAVVVLGLLTFTVISFVLKLVTAAISLAVLALVVWILYKLFFESNSPSTN
jgi:hypothetical protein